MSTNVTETVAAAPSLARRVAFFAYGVTCYAIGVSGLVWLIGVTLGVIPITGGPVQITSMGGAIALDVLLVALFGIQHAIMARPAFKERWTKIVPEPIERSTFTLLAGLLMALAMGLWQPMPQLVWSVGQPAIAMALTAACALGWVYLLAATFCIDHFQLFGLRQVTSYLLAKPSTEPTFVRRVMYRFDRHPIMSGVLVGVWAAPVMTLDRLILALAFTTYVIVGVAIEERDLVRLHGDDYRKYRDEVGTLVPRVVRFDP